MGVDQVSRHDHSTDADGGENIAPTSLSTDESVTVTGDDTITLGREHGATVQGDNVAIGVGARALEDANQTVSGNDPRKVAVGYEAAKNDEQFGTVGVGAYAARDNTGKQTVGVGYIAARRNTGNRTVGVGAYAARGDGLSDVATMGDDNIGIGVSAIRNNQASGLIALGQDAGINAQTDDLMLVTDRDGNRRYKGFLKNKADENASDLETLGAGAGLIVTSSDGSERRRITIDNAGSLVAEVI